MMLAAFGFDVPVWQDLRPPARASAKPAAEDAVQKVAGQAGLYLCHPF